MPSLPAETDRAVRDAVSAFVAGRRAPTPFPDSMYSSRNSRYRVVDGRVTEASDPSVVGAELVGWLVDDRAASIVPTWAFRARGIFFDRKISDVIVTSRILARSPGGEARPEGDKPASIPPAPPIPALKPGGSAPPPADGSKRTDSDQEVTGVGAKSPKIPKAPRTPSIGIPRVEDDGEDTPPRR